jgi:hypothetical protein
MYRVVSILHFVNLFSQWLLLRCKGSKEASLLSAKRESQIIRQNSWVFGE